jgi:hypothetical protein
LEALCEKLDVDEQIGEDNVDDDLELEVKQEMPICTTATTLEKF